LAYLGGIAEAMINDAEARRIFCDKATAALDGLKRLKPEERKKIEKSLAARVPPPTDKQLKRQQLQDLSANGPEGPPGVNRAFFLVCYVSFLH
jgi:hypothetical protein